MMLRLSLKFPFRVNKYSQETIRKKLCYSATKSTERLTEVKSEINPHAEELISSTSSSLHMQQSESSSIDRAESISESSAIRPNPFIHSTARAVSPRHTVKTSLPFEEIPGPAILKLWEKYWRYVPLLGTQLSSCLLINRFTNGRLSWNRNVTPMTFLFDRYGPVVRINGPLINDIVMIHRPEHIAEIFKQESGIPIRSAIDILEHYRLSYRKNRFAGPFSSQGNEWINMRHKIEKPFKQLVEDSFGRVEEVCDDFCMKIRKIRNRQQEVPSNFNEDLIRWGMECFSVQILNTRLGFVEHPGLNASSETEKVVEALATAHLYISRCETGFQVWRIFLTPFAKKLFEACDEIDSLVGKYIRYAQTKYQTSSLSENDKDPVKQNVSMLDKLLFDEKVHPDDVATLLLDSIILGVQAVTNCEAFLLYYLARNPRVQNKLYEEIISVAPSSSTPLTKEIIKNMPYLKACIKESLRLRPAFPYITRFLRNSVTLHGYTIPQGTYVIMATQIASQREENFEDPEKFKPSRWLSDSIGQDNNVKFSCLPFGHGVRSCLGRSIAESQMAILTAKIIQEFRVEYDYGDISSSFYMINVPNKPLRFRFVDRE